MLQSVSQRFGIFVKQKKKTKGFKTRFFIVDNENNLLFTRNLALIERVIRSSENIGQILNGCKDLKKISFKNAKIGPLRLFYTIDTIPLANKNCFELFLENPQDQSVTSFIVFSYQDDQIIFLHEFLKNYHTINLKATLSLSNPIKKLIMARNEENENQPQKSEEEEKQSARDAEEAKNKFQIISKVLTGVDTNRPNNKEMFEDILKQDTNAKVEDVGLIQLENGNTFSGRVRDGKPFGPGTEFIQDGTSYKGEFRNGIWHGAGYMVNSNLDMTEAEFMHGRPVGIQFF